MKNPLNYKEDIRNFFAGMSAGLSDEAVLTLLCERLNRAVEDPEIQRVAKTLLGSQVAVEDTSRSPQFEYRETGDYAYLSTLGFINGLFSSHKIVAIYGRERKELRRFKVVER